MVHHGCPALEEQQLGHLKRHHEEVTRPRQPTRGACRSEPRGWMAGPSQRPPRNTPLATLKKKAVRCDLDSALVGHWHHDIQVAELFGRESGLRTGGEAGEMP